MKRRNRNTPEQLQNLLTDAASGNYTRKTLAKNYGYASLESFCASINTLAKKHAVALNFKASRRKARRINTPSLIESTTVVTEYNSMNDFKSRKNSAEFRTVKFQDGFSIQIEKNAGSQIYVLKDGTVEIR